MVAFNNEFVCSIWTPPFNQAPLGSQVNGESGRASHLVYKFDKQNCEVQQFSDKDP